MAAFNVAYRALLAERRAERRRARPAGRLAPFTTSTADAPHRAALGTGVTVFPPPSPDDARLGPLTSTFTAGEAAQDRAKSGADFDAAEAVRRARREGRFAGRRVLWKISEIPAIRACGRGVIDHDRGVTLRRREGSVHAAGVTHCKSIWACPVCQATIRAVRAADASEAVVRHVKAGGTAYLVTLTARHYQRHKLAPLLDAIGKAFTALVSGAQWAGDAARGREGERARMGVVGIIRSVEVTYGRHGWHPHLHLVVLMGAVQAPRPKLPRKADRPAGWTAPEYDPTPTGHFPIPDPATVDPATLDDDQAATLADFRRMQERWDRQWAAWLGKHGFRPSAKHGVRWDRIHTVRDAQKVGDYVAKTQDGKGVGNELARGDMKSASRMASAPAGGRTPMELLQDYRAFQGMDLDQAEAAGIDPAAELARIRKVWAEYEAATRGRRAIEWSRGLRAALGMTDEEQTEDEIVAASVAGDAFAAIDTDTWRRVCRLGQDYAVLLAAELGGFAGLTDALAVLGLEATEMHPDGEDGPTPPPGPQTAVTGPSAVQLAVSVDCPE